MASRGSGSQQKGKAYERSIGNILTRAFGVQVRRTPSPERWKTTNLGDLNASKDESTILNDFFWECKKREAFAPLTWYKKAQNDSGPNQKPVVVASKNHEDNFVFLSLMDFLQLLIELEEYRKKG